MKVKHWILCGILFYSYSTCAQRPDSLAAVSLYTAEDSLSIFSLIDSLLSLEKSTASQLAVRIGYNSNVISAGRTLGIENFGLAPSLSYFHRSGLFADVTAFYSQDFQPKYYLTVASAGYMKDVSRHFSVMANYDRYFYNIENVYIPYSNTISITPMFDWKMINLSASYSFYFGDQHAHRLMPAVGFTLEKTNFWKIDRLAIMPAVYMLYGNEVVITLEYVSPETLREAIRNLRDYGTIYRAEIKERNIYGVMNYALSVPATINFDRWSLSLSYTYNIPRALPGEPDDLSESTFISGSLMYLIPLQRRKKPL
jgi:hypothetical protein